MRLLFALLTAAIALEDEASLIQGPEWTDRLKNSPGFQDGLSHTKQLAAQDMLVKINKGVTLIMTRVHTKLDRAHTVIADKRAALDKDLAATKTLVDKAELMNNYMEETLPTWTGMVENGTEPLLDSIERVNARFHRRPAVRDFMEVANRSLINAVTFVDEMENVQNDWSTIADSKMTEQDALKMIQAVQAKAEKGLKVFQNSEDEFTAGWQKFSAKFAQFGTAVGAEADTVNALRTLTQNIHDECIMVGRKSLRAFTELVGGMDDGRANLAKSVQS